MAEHKLAIFSFVIAVVLLGFVIFVRLPSIKLEPPPPLPAPPAAPPPPASPQSGTTAQIYIVSMDANGFIPPELTVRPGDSVIFKNNDTRQRWPASDPHPTHGRCKGFDALQPVNFGDTYTMTFTAAGECSYHDHILPTLKGNIIVAP